MIKLKKTDGNQSTRVLESAIRAATNSVEIENPLNKGGAFIINVAKAGTLQVETATVIANITLSGDIEVIITSAILVGSPLTTTVAVLNEDTGADVASKIRTALGNISAITDDYTIGGATDKVILTAIEEAANDATLNIDVHTTTATGLTDDTTSENTTGGTATIDVIPEIQGKDEVNSVYYTILTGATITAAGLAVLKVYPGITPSANAAVSDILPKHMRLVMTHGDAVEATYSVVLNSNR